MDSDISLYYSKDGRKVKLTILHVVGAVHIISVKLYFLAFTSLHYKALRRSSKFTLSNV